MRRTGKQAGLIITSAAAGLATLSQCSAGLLGDLFDKHSDKDRAAIEKRLPACDCSFGYFSTAWQPWGTCDDGRETGCTSGRCRTSPPVVMPGFQPGYSHALPSTELQPYHDIWSQPGTMTMPSEYPHTFPGDQRSEADGPSPILMMPQQSGPPTNYQGIPSESSPTLVNPYSRAIPSSPELPGLNANPYSPPVPGNGQSFTPQPGRAFDGSLDPPQPSLNLPTPSSALPRQASPESSSNFGSSGTGLNLPPRRATSVTIDVPAGSAGSTLTLPDPVRSGVFGGAVSPSPTGLPSTGFPANSDTNSRDADGRFPAVTPGTSVTPPMPQPSLRPQPPVPAPSVSPGSAAAYQYRDAPPQQFQPATHWQAVPQIQPSHQTGWRVMPGAYSQNNTQQPQVQRQQQPLTPSERVIYLSPPPRR